MLKEVYEDIYTLEMVLPNNPLKSLNSYIVKGNNRSLVIDTAFDTTENRNRLFASLKKLKIKIKDTDLFITHLHSDHSGMAHIFKEANSNIYVSKIDGYLINQMTKNSYWENMYKFIKLFDLKKDKVNFKEHPGYKYSLKEVIDFIPMKEGKGIQIGKYFFEVIDIPGHTPGHIGLYERANKLFFGGDHILDKITPNIGFWELDENILLVYLNSLGKIYSYGINYLFPAHRNIIKDHSRRINEIISHHKERLEEIKDIVSTTDGLSVRDIASKMKWSIRVNTWEEFPNPQKWFASNEAMSHLEYLYHINILQRIERDGKLYYNLK